MRFANEFGFCDLNEFPGCSQMVVSNHAFIYKEHRGLGHGDSNHKKRLERAKALGYDAMVCTVRGNNAPQIAILKKNKWEKVWQFYSRQTEQLIEVWTKTL